MQVLNSFFADNRMLSLGAAAVAFLVFAVFFLLLVRLLFGSRLRMSGGRGRQQRLGVVDAYDMDKQRQLVLVRRDNTEHLIMIGGPNDLLIESTILRVDEREGRARSASLPRDTGAAEPPRIPMPDMKATSTTDAPLEPASGVPGPMSQPMVTVPALEPVPAMPMPPAEPVPPLAAQSAAPAPAGSLSKDAPRLPDLFARMRTAPRPAAVPREPPGLAPPVEAPINETPVRQGSAGEATPSLPASTADLLESGIADALSPATRIGVPPLAPEPAVPAPEAVAPEPIAPEPVAPADKPLLDLETLLGTAPMESAAAPPPLAEPLPQSSEPAATPAVPVRPTPRPFRPFPPLPRREPLAAPSTDTARATDAAKPSRPPPPPFFSRMQARPKDRVEPTVETPVASAEGPAGPASEIIDPPVPAEVPPTAVAAPQEAAPPAAAPPEASAPAAESLDPFEEEMARLLGRKPGKDG